MQRADLCQDEDVNVPRSHDVSVVIPCYNSAAYLPAALESVFGQTSGDHEVIVVDDGSSDETPAILDRYAPRLRSIRQDNAGAAAARNRGAREARGRWLAFLDADDVWPSNRLERMIAYLRDHAEVKVLATAARVMTAAGAPTRRVVRRKRAGERLTTFDFLTREKGLICGAGVLVDRDCFLDVGGFDPDLPPVEDCDLWLRLSRHVPMAILNEPLLLYRKHDRNLTRDILRNAERWIRLLEKFRNEHGDFVRQHPWVFRRAVAGQQLRFGRELLAVGASDPASRREARRALLRSLRAFPLPRAALYLALASTAPRLYARLRRHEVKFRRRRVGEPVGG